MELGWNLTIGLLILNVFAFAWLYIINRISKEQLSKNQ
ncbi:hypothetical protein DNAOFDDG_01693 [Mannheimia haemolytica]|uniref:Uncharacterized protein n=1 Tax=Mannheimia haemolytica TaxID=75985 RepID=A0A378N6L8_MANHA|nr:hypothetical protein F382_00125 [Mannheimia haemolytica D153]AGQ37610.1 hypothetical protein J450_00060 [Mannheimia haemolytica D171]AGQ40022.1 hypothetical protein J451_00095 [Mannheimia haemolytica D174]AGR75263.1 hypothetical protein N220_08095 [Mannheimia haemolytica USMARC_2286]EEY11754.1 hypothetical protein COK_2188 [Mannheimia haemolytica serotype A2 str. BOVINE]EPY99742.1 hypothetical protein L278_08760 [Mannheimia haemolytica D35]EPZ03135.1 hypothetical protein L279_06355 [Mannhe